ncbi:hypothetical protein C8T65DRAFT_744492 [Cerioporus squamosus]|nr:hypothetical protein C8T65DRAFT_744492 [Cerioporus squamosus]
MEPSATVCPPRRHATALTPAISKKAQARMIRQTILEHEQQVEELEALKVTAEELNALQESFAAVKAEFVDLDGQSWETPTAREMLVDWRARRSLAAVVSPTSSLHAIAPIENEDVFSDATVRGRPAKASVSDSNATGGVPGPVRAGREDTRRTMILSTVEDDDDPNDVTLLAPPGLVNSLSLSAKAEASLKQAPANPAMSASSSAAVFSFSGRSALSSASAAIRPDSTVSALGTTVLSNSPTLNQRSTFLESADAGTVRAGPAPKRRTGCSTVVATGDIDPEDVETVLHEFFPGIRVDPVGSAPPHAISKLSGPWPRHVTPSNREASLFTVSSFSQRRWLAWPRTGKVLCL